MAYFALRCFSPQVGKYMIIALNVVVAILGVTHWGFAGLYGSMKSYSIATGVVDPSVMKLYDSPAAYFAISGIVQVAVSVFCILLLLEVVGKENKLRWARGIIIALVFEFAFDFFIAVYTSMMATYFNSAFMVYLNYTWDYISAISDSNIKGMFTTIKSFVPYCTAEAIITWLISIPAVSIIILGLTDQLLNENTVNEMGKLIAVPSKEQIPARGMAVIQPVMNDSIMQPNNFGSNNNINQPAYIQPQYK